MAASGENIETQIRVKSTQLIQNLNGLKDDFFPGDDVQKNNAAQKKVQTLVEEYHQFLRSLQPTQSASSDKFKLAVDTLEETINRLLLQNDDQYRGFTFDILSAMIKEAEQQLNQNFLSTALRQKVSEILLSKLEIYNKYFFVADIKHEMYNTVRDWLKIALENYYWVCNEKQDFVPTVNLFRTLDEDKKRHFCTMVYYTDQQWGLADNTSLLSVALIEAGVITLQDIQESLKAFSQPSDHSNDKSNQQFRVDGSNPVSSEDKSSQDVRDDKESDETGCLAGFSCNIGLQTSEWIEQMPPTGQLAAGFLLSVMGALMVAAGVLATLIVAFSVVPSFGFSTPLAIGGCIFAGGAIVSGVTLMTAGIKVVKNAPGFFSSPSEVPKSSSSEGNFFRNFYSSFSN